MPIHPVTFLAESRGVARARESIVDITPTTGATPVESARASVRRQLSQRLQHLGSPTLETESSDPGIDQLDQQLIGPV